MTTIFFILSFVLHNNAVKYSPTPFPILIQKATIIGQGEILAIRDKTIQVKFSKLLKGNLEERIIFIQKFEDWTCAQRWTNYETGQAVLFYIYRQENSWRILGAGNEGEMPIENNFTYYKSPYGCLNKTATEYNFDNGKLCGHKFQNDDLETAIKAYNDNPEYYKRIASDDKRKQLKNPVLELITQELEMFHLSQAQ